VSRSTPRLEPIAAADRTPEQQSLVEKVGSDKHIFTTLVRHPRLFEVFNRFAGRLLRRSSLPDTVRETLILRTAYRAGSGYEWAQHVEIATSVGLPAEVIAQLDRDAPEIADPHVVLLVKAADELALQRYLEQDTWDALAQTYDEQQMIEICMLVGNYAMIAGVLKSLHVQLEDGQAEPSWAR
jgi:4-carboxymuconolactone decarboxylase